MDMRAWLAGGLALLGAAMLLDSAGVAAKQPKDEPPPPPQVNALLACRAITDSEQRLACYDKSAAAIGDAVAKRELVVFDKESVKKTKRGLFGFSIPNLGIFGDEDDEVEIKQIDGEIVSTGLSADGSYTFRLADGSRWSQIDSKPIALEPQTGDKVVVKKGALGSYIMSIAKQSGVKVKRIN
jgi:hypothetical protein